MDFYEQTFGECPHGYIKPYCALCLRADRELKRQEREKNREADGLRRTVAKQSEALDDAYDYIRSLQRRLRR